MHRNTMFTCIKNIRLSVYVEAIKRKKERKQKGHGRLMILTIMKQRGLCLSQVLHLRFPSPCPETARF